MSVIKIKNENGEFVDIPVIQGEKGDTGPQGLPGPAGTSVNVIEATDEANAITLSTQNPNNVYFWEE